MTIKKWVKYWPLLIFAAILVVFLLSPGSSQAAPDSALPTTAEGEKGIQLTTLINYLYITLSWVTLTASVIAGLIGAYMYMASGGDPKKITTAKDIVVRAAIGMLVVALAYTFFQSLF
mgnify:CR=1 FL=1